MKKFTSGLKIILFCLSCAFLWGFRLTDHVEENTNFIQSSIVRHYDKDQENAGLKRFELNVTNTGFCRYKKFYTSGKVEYFAFNIASFKDLDYYGTTENGSLWLRTQQDDVIVQTYNDKAGDIDSMGTYMVIPLKAIEADELNMLSKNFAELKKLLPGSSTGGKSQ
jgi:hypothetical protein